MGFFTDLTAGAGNAAFALGRPFREEARRAVADQEQKAAAAKADFEKYSTKAEKLRREHQLEDEDRAPGLAAQVQTVQQRGLDRDHDRGKDFLTHQTDEGIRAIGVAVPAKIAVSTADYNNQGTLDTTRTRNEISRLNATYGGQRGLLGGTYMDLLDAQRRAGAGTQGRFIGSTPLMEQLGANQRDSQRDYLNTVLELDRRNQPQGIAKFSQQLAPIVGLGASILSAFL
jgi:hypothetical protein